MSSKIRRWKIIFEFHTYAKQGNAGETRRAIDAIWRSIARAKLANRSAGSIVFVYNIYFSVSIAKPLIGADIRETRTWERDTTSALSTGRTMPVTKGRKCNSHCRRRTKIHDRVSADIRASITLGVVRVPSAVKRLKVFGLTRKQGPNKLCYKEKEQKAISIAAITSIAKFSSYEQI